MPDLRPGNLTNAPTNYDAFDPSMAKTIEDELNLLLQLDDLPPLSTDSTDREVRDRRRFFIAIARGVVRHLVENPDAFVVTFDGADHKVTINSEQL